MLSKLHIVERRHPQVTTTRLDGIPPLLQRLYLARGIKSVQELDLSLSQLLPPTSLGGISVAVDLLATAIIAQKRITVVGDYDADGATASALSVLVLRELGAQHVNFLIPNRFTMGYGLGAELVDQAAADGAELLLTVDTGISSITGVAKARALGMQVIITDHHLSCGTLPNANAIVNPNLPTDQFPAKHTAGVGVAFYLLASLRQRLQPSLNMAKFLDLVALGTVADVVPLEHNNRILVEYGLRLIRAGRCRPGITALLKVAKRPITRTIAEDLAFYVGPRLNAAGRLDTMDLGISCLLCDDPTQAMQYAEMLDEVNRTRRSIELKMQDQALAVLANIKLTGELPLGLCLYDIRWHEGVVGLLASKLKERYQRPVIALAPGEEDGIVKGSARSIPEVHIRDLLAVIEYRYPDILIRYGGHPIAAGLTIQRSKVELFKQAFAEAITIQLNGHLPDTQILSDGVLDATEFTTTTANALRYAGPWGQGFPPPLFSGEFRVLSQKHVGGTHLKLLLKTQDTPNLDAIFFNWGTHKLEAEYIEIVYTLDVNEYQGRETIQLIIKYLGHCV